MRQGRGRAGRGLHACPAEGGVPCDARHGVVLRNSLRCRSVQTTAASQMLKRAAHADPMPALLGCAPQAPNPPHPHLGARDWIGNRSFFWIQIVCVLGKKASDALPVNVRSYINYPFMEGVFQRIPPPKISSFSGVVDGLWGWLDCGVARRTGRGAGARSARQHLISSRLFERSVSAVSSATRPTAEHRSAVGASRPPR